MRVACGPTLLTSLALGLLAACGAAPSAPVTTGQSWSGLQVRLDSAGIARTDWPLAVDLPGVEATARVRIGVAEAQCEAVPGGVRAHWIEAQLPAAGVVARTVTIQSCPAPQPDLAARFHAVPTDDGEGIWLGDACVVRSVTAFDPARFDDTSKPYCHLYAPDLPAPLTKGLGGLYPHHRGLFLGWNRTVVGSERWDFWHCKGGARQRFVASESRLDQLGPVLAHSVARTDWVAPGERVVVEDTRELTLWRPNAGRQQIDLTVTLCAPTAAVRLESDPHHSGVHVRLAREVEKSLATYLRAGVTEARGDDVWRGGTAVLACFTSQAQPCAVALLADPSATMPRWWSTRSYGRFGVTWDTALTPGTPQTHRFRLLILNGTAAHGLDAGWLELQSRAFGTPVEVQLARGADDPGNR